MDHIIGQHSVAAGIRFRGRIAKTDPIDQFMQTTQGIANLRTGQFYSFNQDHYPNPDITDKWWIYDFMPMDGLVFDTCVIQGET